MKSISLSKASGMLGDLVKEAASDHEPVYIQGEDSSVVLINEEDWRAIQETLYLISIPGMRESIKEGMHTPLNECSEEPGW